MGGGHSLLDGANAARADLHSSSDERLRAEIAVHLHLAQDSAPSLSNRELLERAYAEADANADGKLDFDEFAAIASRIGLGVAELQLRAAFSRFDADADGRITFSEVVDFISPVLAAPDQRAASRAQRSGAISTRHAPPTTRREYAAREVQVQHFERMAASREAEKRLHVEEPREVPSAVHRIAREVYTQQISLRNAFKLWDLDGSGALDVNEFTAALNSLGFSVDLPTSKALFKAFDIDGNGKIQAWELIRMLSTLTDEAPPPQRQDFDNFVVEVCAPPLRAAGAAVLEGIPPPGGGARQASPNRRKGAGQPRRPSSPRSASPKRANSPPRRASPPRLASPRPASPRAPSPRPASPSFQPPRPASPRGQRPASPRAPSPSRARKVETTSELLPSDTITSNTSVYEMGVYAWNLSQGDAMDDRALLATLVKRLKYLRISAAEALSQCVREPRIGQGDPCEGRGVEKNAMVAFCHQLLLSITERRAAQFLRGELCGAVDGSGEVGPIASVPRFLALFGEGRATGVAMNGRKAGKNDRIAPVKRDIRVNPLSAHERVLLTRLRESLFERHAKMKSMFESLDPNGDGFVTIEEGEGGRAIRRCDGETSRIRATNPARLSQFLHALTRAGVAITGEIDRRAASVSADEAAHLLAFFDRDGDGCLEYNEFMRLLQDSKHQVMASAEISKAGVGQIMPRARAQPVDARDQLLESTVDIS